MYKLIIYLLILIISPFYSVYKKEGSLKVMTEPINANIYIDNVLVCKVTPCVVEALPPLMIKISIKNSDIEYLNGKRVKKYEDYEAYILIKSGEELYIEHNFQFSKEYEENIKIRDEEDAEKRERKTNETIRTISGLMILAGLAWKKVNNDKGIEDETSDFLSSSLIVVGGIGALYIVIFTDLHLADSNLNDPAYLPRKSVTIGFKITF